MRITDTAIVFLCQAEREFANASETLRSVPDGVRFAVQQQVNRAREQFDDFRARMSEL